MSARTRGDHERRVMPESAASHALQDYVAGVSPDELTRAAVAGTTDAGTERLLEAERPVIQAWRRRTGRPETAGQGTGLALSGGGIRSAAFSLGVIQALAGRDLLSRMDYLSSVSGGGYMAASIVRWLSPAAGGRFGVAPGDFPYGVAAPGCEDPKARPDQSALLKTSCASTAPT